MSGAARGDRNAWARLVDRFAPTVWAVTQAATDDPVVSAEAAQTTWLRFADRLVATTDVTSFEAWLADTARREVHRSASLRGVSPAGA